MNVQHERFKKIRFNVPHCADRKATKDAVKRSEMIQTIFSTVCIALLSVSMGWSITNINNDISRGKPLLLPICVLIANGLNLSLQVGIFLHHVHRDRT